MEIFKIIDGYDGDYLISNKGNVKSLKNKKEMILTNCINTRGYLYVKLSKQNHKKLFIIHRLVAEYFIPNPHNKPYVNHIDGNKQNNDVSNLEWVTCSENIKHAYDTGLNYVSYENRMKTIKRNKEYSSKMVDQIDKITMEVVKTWVSMAEASRELNIHASDISKCCRDKTTKEGVQVDLFGDIINIYR